MIKKSLMTENILNWFKSDETSENMHHRFGIQENKAIVSMQLSVSSIRQVVDQNNGEEQVCEERDGWCVPGTKDKLRDMISGMIKKVVRAQKPGK